MELSELFRKAVQELRARNIKFALAGGLIASVYRSQARTTTDIDLLIAVESADTVAKEIIESFGLQAFVARQAQLEGGPLFAIKKNSTPICIVVGRNPNDQNDAGLDFILPAMPW